MNHFHDEINQRIASMGPSSALEPKFTDLHCGNCFVVNIVAIFFENFKTFSYWHSDSVVPKIEVHHQKCRQ